MPTLPVEALEELDALAISTTDHEVRLKLIELLAERGAKLFQGRLLDRACAPGRATVRRSAAHAMLAQQHPVEQAIIDRIDAGMVATRIAGVASRLLLILSVRGSEQTLLHIGRELAGRSKRRAMVLLAVWATRDTRPGLAAELTQLLPAGHSVIAWLEAERRRPIDDPLVSDLGDPAVCTEVLGWLNFRLGP